MSLQIRIEQVFPGCTSQVLVLYKYSFLQPAADELLVFLPKAWNSTFNPWLVRCPWDFSLQFELSCICQRFWLKQNSKKHCTEAVFVYLNAAATPGQHSAVREGKARLAFLISAAGDLSSKGAVLRCLGSIGSAHQKPHWLAGQIGPQRSNAL